MNRRELRSIEPLERTPHSVRSPKTAELVSAALRRMIVDGDLVEGDFLPTESQLMEHFKVCRPTLREAVRILESDRLVEVRRGSRTGARVRIPGPEIVARPAGLLLELSGATLADVTQARTGLELNAVRILADRGTTAAFDALRALIDELPGASDGDALGRASAALHRQIVELTGVPTLILIAGMLYEITARHIQVSIRTNVDHVVPRAQYVRFRRSFDRLHELLVERRGDEAERHWQRHMEISNALILANLEQVRVRDVL
jgi:GntR family transcriptional repressor for pyruvate dehydrogenase complex